MGCFTEETPERIISTCLGSEQEKPELGSPVPRGMGSLTEEAQASAGKSVWGPRRWGQERQCQGVGFLTVSTQLRVFLGLGAVGYEVRFQQIPRRVGFLYCKCKAVGPPGTGGGRWELWIRRFSALYPNVAPAVWWEKTVRNERIHIWVQLTAGKGL